MSAGRQMAACLNTATLTALASGELLGDAARAAEAHLDKCRRCAMALAKLPVDEELVARVRELKHWRQELRETLSDLKQVEEHVTTTLFGRRPS